LDGINIYNVMLQMLIVTHLVHQAECNSLFLGSDENSIATHFSKYWDTKFHENPFSAIIIVIWEADRHEGADGSILTAEVTNGTKFAAQCTVCLALRLCLSRGASFLTPDIMQKLFLK
jgi:hypothetical protein